MGSSFNDGKDDGAMRTIGEVAKAIGVKAHVLRYWEQQFPMLQPLKRSGGRRYYRSDDIELVEYIHRLVNDDGYTLKGARKVLESGKSGNGSVGHEAKASPAAAIALADGGERSSDREGESVFGSDPGSVASSVESTFSAQEGTADTGIRMSSGPSKKEIVSRLKVIRCNLEEASET